MTALAQAEALAKAGWPVFPCKEDKSPACRHGFKDAATSVDGVRWLWRHYPGPLIGVRTGEASGVDVLDVDPRNGGHHWYLSNRHKFPATRMHRTRSDGLHVCFRHENGVRNTESKIAPGVDTRGEGGYFIFWPATGCAVVEAPIASWPRWLLRCLLQERPTPKRRSGPITPLNNNNDAHGMAARALQRVADAREGQRHYMLRAAACTLGGLLDALPFGEGEAKQRLVDAAKQAGAHDLVNAERTAAWGLARGKLSPLRVGGGRS